MFNIFREVSANENLVCEYLQLQLLCFSSIFSSNSSQMKKIHGKNKILPTVLQDHRKQEKKLSQNHRSTGWPQESKMSQHHKSTDCKPATATTGKKK